MNVRVNAATVSNSGTITGGNAVYATVAITVINTGSINGTNNGVQLAGGGYLSNGSGVRQISASNIGVYTAAAATIVNAGTIAGRQDRRLA